MPLDIISLKTCFDEIAETDGDDECKAWLNKIFDAKGTLADFVASRREGGGTGYFVGFLKGSFNLAFRIAFSNGGPDAIIRFPKPGHTATALRDEKVTNEMSVMDYLRQHTTIPLPRVHAWGLTAESPLQLGPFIIMDLVDGVLLSSVLKMPTEDDLADQILNPDLDEMVLDTIYAQIAVYLLQLSRLPFSQIGAISNKEESQSNPSETWSVTGRPLTYNMNELASVAKYPEQHFSTAPFTHASDYLKHVAREHLTHAWTQRNLAYDEDTARRRFVARHRFSQLISKFCLRDDGPFLLSCDDMRPANMLVDPATLRITAVLDWEFTNAMPAQFSYDPPAWLLVSGPDVWLDRGALEEFVRLYEPRLEQFLRALERAEEAGKEAEPPDEPLLSARMRESWQTKRFWFDYAARKGFDVDAVYWATLHDDSDTDDLPDPADAEVEAFVQTKMDQLHAYKEECRARFSSGS